MRKLNEVPNRKKANASAGTYCTLAGLVSILACSPCDLPILFSFSHFHVDILWRRL